MKQVLKRQKKQIKKHKFNKFKILPFISLLLFFNTSSINLKPAVWKPITQRTSHKKNKIKKANLNLNTKAELQTNIFDFEYSLVKSDVDLPSNLKKQISLFEQQLIKQVLDKLPETFGPQQFASTFFNIIKQRDLVGDTTNDLFISDFQNKVFDCNTISYILYDIFLDLFNIQLNFIVGSRHTFLTDGKYDYDIYAGVYKIEKRNFFQRKTDIVLMRKFNEEQLKSVIFLNVARFYLLRYEDEHKNYDYNKAIYFLNLAAESNKEFEYEKYMSFALFLKNKNKRLDAAFKVVDIHENYISEFLLAHVLKKLKSPFAKIHFERAYELAKEQGKEKTLMLFFIEQELGKN